MPVISGGNVIDGAQPRQLTTAGAPSSGTSGSYAGSAPPGAMLVDVTNGLVYSNTNTQTSPTWTRVPNQTAQSIPRTALDERVVEAHTAGDTLLAAETGSVHTNTGASGTITLILPAAVVGLEFSFGVGASFELRLDPAASETISLPSSGVAGAAGKYLVADLTGETVHLMCVIAGTWGVFGYTGTWSAEG